MLGVAILIRWDIGLYGGLSMLAGSYLSLLAHRLGLQPDGNGFTLKGLRFTTLLLPLKELAWAWGPMLAIAVVGYGGIGMVSHWKNMFEQVFYFPTAILHSVRWMPYPSLIPGDFPPSNDWLRFYAPLLTLAITLGVLIYIPVKKRAALTTPYFAIISLAIFGGLLFNQALSRYDIIHVTPASIIVLIVAAALIAHWVQAGNMTWGRYPLYLLCLGLVALYFTPSLRDILNNMDTYAPWGCYSHLEKVGCIALPQDQELAVQYIQTVTQPTDAIFVGNQKHDRIFVSDIGFYYLADRLSGSRYHELYPGVATTLPVQTEIVEELASKSIQWVVLVKIWDSNEPNGSALSSGVKYLDEYLRTQYVSQAEFGNYKILKKR